MQYVIDDSERQASIALYYERKRTPWFHLDPRLEEVIDSSTAFDTVRYIWEKYKDEFMFDGKSWYHRDRRSGFFLPTGRDCPALQDLINITFLKDVDRHVLQLEMELNNMKRCIVYEIEPPVENTEAIFKTLNDRISRALSYRRDVAHSTASIVKSLKGRYHRLLPAQNISLLTRTNDPIEQWVAMNLVPLEASGYLLPASDVYQALGPRLQEACTPAQLGETISRLLAPDKKKDGGVIHYTGLRLV